MSGTPIDEEERRRAAEEARRILEESGALEAVRRELRAPEPAARPLSAESAEPQGMFRQSIGDLPEARVVSSTRTVRQAPAVVPPSLEQQTRDVEAPPRQLENARQAQAVGDAYRQGRPEPYRAEPSDWEMEDLQIGRPGATRQPTPAVPPPVGGTTPTAGGAAAPAAPSGVRERLEATLRERLGARLGDPSAPARSITVPLAPTGVAGALGDPSVAFPGGPSAPRSDIIRDWDAGGSPRERLRAILAAKAAQQAPNPSPEAAPALPQRDYTGIDVADRLVSPLRGIARGLLYASGHSPGPLTTWGGQQRARDAAEDARTMAARQEQAQINRAGASDELARERLGLERERMVQQGEERAADRTLRQQLQERLAAQRAQGSQSREALAAAQLDAFQSDRRRAEALRLAASPETQQLRDQVRARMQSIPGLVQRTDPSVMRWLDTATGEQIAEYAARNGIETRARDLLHRRGGGGGSGGGGTSGADSTPREQWGTEADPVMRSAMEQGVPEAVARSLVTSPSERTRFLRTLASGALTAERGEQGRQDSDTRDLGRALDQQLTVSRAAQHANELVRRASDTELRAAFMGGAIGSITPARIQELRSAVNELQAQVIRERSGASVSDAEFSRMREELGSMPTRSPEVFRRWVDRSVNLARDMRGRIRARYDDDVISTYEGRLRREGVDVGSATGNRPSTATQPARQDPPGTVRVRLRNGQPSPPLTQEQLARWRERFPDAEVIRGR